MGEEVTDAFQEVSTPRNKPPKAIKLPLKEDGSIDWESTSSKHTQAFIDAIKVDPNGILDNIKEEAGQTASGESTGIADATVLAATNLIMISEALLITSLGSKWAPPLKNLHPIVAIKACTVSLDEMQPVMPECKRIIKRYVPMEYLSQEYQDIAIVAKHLIGLSVQKFKDCVDLAVKIEAMKNAPQPSKANGRVIIDAEPASS